jgi:hypothetical protein
VGRSAVGGSGQGLINRLIQQPGFADEIVEHKAARRPSAGTAASSGGSTSSITLPFKFGEFARQGLVTHHVASQPDFLQQTNRPIACIKFPPLAAKACRVDIRMMIVVPAFAMNQ